MKKILIRFDDICPTMDFSQFEKACTLMDKYGVKPLIGVIPDCTDPDLQIESERSDFWNYVKVLQNKGYTIAMHGLNHVFCSQRRGIVTPRVGSEFAGLPLEQQKEMIKRGKVILESHGIHTDVFFAPAHSYDWNTLDALAQNGFNYMSDGKSTKPYSYQGIKCLPCRSHGCPKTLASGYSTVLFHAHEWNRTDRLYDYDRFVNLIEQHHDEIISFDEYAQRECGNFIMQRLDEMLYLKWQFHIKPYLARIRNRILSK